MNSLDKVLNDLSDPTASIYIDDLKENGFSEEQINKIAAIKNGQVDLINQLKNAANGQKNNRLNEVLDVLLNPNLELSKEFLNQSDYSKKEIEQLNLINNQLFLYNKSMQEEQKELNKLLKESRSDTFQVITKLKSTLKDTLEESRKAQFLSKVMFGLTFLLGYILIGVAVYFGIQGQQVLAIAFGSFGMIDIIAHLIADPPLKLQDSRSNYSQLTIGNLAWFNDLIDKSSIISENHELAKLALNKPSQSKEYLQVIDKNIDNYLKVSNTQIENTSKLLTLMDEVAEPTKKIIEKEKSEETE